MFRSKWLRYRIITLTVNPSTSSEMYSTSYWHAHFWVVFHLSEDSHPNIYFPNPPLRLNLNDWPRINYPAESSFGQNEVDRI